MMDNIIYFLNNIANQDVTKNERLVNGLFMIGLPGVLALFIVLVTMKKYRSIVFKLNICVVVLYLFCIIFPQMIVIHSLIFLNQVNLIPLTIILYSIYGLVYWVILQYYYPKYLYKTDEDYLKSIPDGRNSVVNFSHSLRLQVLNIIYATSYLLILVSGVMFFSDSNSNFALIVCITGGAIWLLFLVWFRWWVRCPVCNSTVYGGKKENNKTYFICTMIRIFRYDCFTCMYCYAHIKVGKRDIIKEKNLEIINMHQPDFQVKKKGN